MPSNRSPPFNAVGNPSSPSYTNVNVDLPSESEIPDSDFADSQMVVAESEFPDSEMLMAGSYFNDSEFVVAGSDLPDSVLDESIIPETQLEFQGFAAESGETRKRKASCDEIYAAIAELASAKAAKVVAESIIPETQHEFEGFAAESRGTRKRKASGVEWKAAMAEMASAKAAKEANVFAECREEMLRILLPSYFKLVRSFPVYLWLACGWILLVFVAGLWLDFVASLWLDFVAGLWLNFVFGLWLDYCWRLGSVH